MSLFRRIFGKSTENEDTPETAEAAPPATEEKSAAPTPSATELDSLDTQPTEIPQIQQVADGVTRPLSPEPVITARNNHLTFGQSSDTGMVRSNNQDSVLSFFFTSKSADQRPDFGLFIVADGMGGHHDGEKASALTARIVANHVISNIYLPMLGGESDDADRPTISEALIAAVKQANNEVLKEVPDGGTTLTAAAILGDLVHIVHVGDSRAYLISQSTIEQITRDHSLVQRLIELNQLTRDEADEHPQKNVLYRAIGQSDTLEVDTVTRRLPANSALLICSDGLWGHLEDDILFETVKQHSVPQEACDRLISLANTKGGTDNITAILLKIPGK